jgi:type VI secretion system protein VasD
MRPLLILTYILFCASLSACANGSTPLSAVGKIADIALEATGLKKPAVPEIPDLQKPPRNVALKLHAGENLNAGTTEKPLSLVARVYKLKQTGTFYSAPYDAFLTPEKEKQVLGADLLEVREINLVPGQLYEVIEKVSRESSYIGVVALFRAPAPQRWRAAFAAKDAETQGVTMGLHACSFTLGKGAVSDQANVVTDAAPPARCQ